MLDLGANTGGWVEIGITQGDGTQVRLGYSELRDYLTANGDNCCANSLGANDDPNGRTDVFATSSPGDLRSPGIRGAERYISLQLEAAGSVSIDYVRVQQQHVRAAEADYAGHFLSSDKLLNRVWYASAYTFALDSFSDPRPGFESTQPVVTDGAKRDRLIWAGDLALENLLGNYSLAEAPSIIRHSLQAFSCQQRADGQVYPTSQIAAQCPADPPPPGTAAPPSAQPALGSVFQLPEYTASWIVALHDYYLYTADADFAGRMMPVLRSGLAYFLNNLDANGLYSTPSTGFVINWHPFDPAGGEDAHTNATLYRALMDGAALEREVGAGDGAADAYAQNAASIKAAMLSQLWDSSAGAFIINTSDPRRNHTQDAQVEAVFGGVTDSAQSQQALDFISSHLLRIFGVANGEFDADAYMSNYISPFISGTELLARLDHGDTSGALDLIRRTWGHMLVKGPGTLWEKTGFDGMPANYAPGQAAIDPFANQGSGGTSLAHGWSGGPVPALSGYVLGIRPLSAGYRQWIVAPQVGDLRFAQGAAPTPYGAIESRWKRDRLNRWFKLTVSAPAGTVGTVELPALAGDSTVAVDGKIASTADPVLPGVAIVRTGDVVRFQNVTGVHTFAVTAG